MSNPITLLSAANVEETGSTWEVAVGRKIVFALFRSGPGTTSAEFQGSLDGANWFNLGSTTPDVQVFTTPVKYIRAHYAGSTSTGTVTIQAIQSDFEDD